MRCHAWVARFKMCGVKSEDRSPRCEKACTTYPTPGGSEVTHKSHRNYDNDANPSVSYQAAAMCNRELPCFLQKSGAGSGTEIPQLFYTWRDFGTEPLGQLCACDGTM